MVILNLRFLIIYLWNENKIFNKNFNKNFNENFNKNFKKNF